MNRSDLVNRIADQIVSARAHPGGIVGLMLESEVAEGGVPYDPGPEWVPGVIVRRGDEVRLVAILAKRPGSGALGRLIGRIEAEGLRPVVIQPVGPVMVSILKRWKWKHTIVGNGWERVEEWRPKGPHHAPDTREARRERSERGRPDSKPSHKDSQ